MIWVSLKISVTWYSPVVQRIEAKTNCWSLGLICSYRGWTQTKYRLCRCLLICLSFWSSKTKGHCSENHSFSEPIIMNDRLWTMKVVIENVRKFVCVMKTKSLCLGNFHFPAQPTSRFAVFIRNTFVGVGYNIRRSLNYALFWHHELKLVRGFKSIWDEGLTLKISASLSLNCGNLTLDHQLVWCQILVFHFPTNVTLQFLSKLTILIIIIS